MPFKSKSQRRFFHAAADRGEMPRSTVRRWEKETPKGKKLPEKVAASAGDRADDMGDSRLRAIMRLMKMKPEVRKRYLADMAANNHQLPMILEPKTAAQKEPVSGKEREEFYQKHGRNPGCSLARDKDGYFVYTHRARSKSYPRPSAIPADRVKFIESTG